MRCSLFFVAAVMAAFPAVAASPADELLDSARQALARGDKDDALRLASKAVDADPKNAVCYAVRASIRDTRREFDKAVADYSQAIELSPTLVAGYERRGEDYFRLGQFKQSVADFDKVISIQPAREPYHWQRGISLYYDGEFARGAKQFETHKTVNPEDVENAVWHYLCVARATGIEQARKELIAIRRDTRVPMMQVYDMFAGKLTPDDVLNAVKRGNPSDEEMKQRLFYAHLYIGLFEEAAGHAAAARQHISLAAGKYAEDDYMGDVARVHWAILKHADEPK